MSQRKLSISESDALRLRNIVNAAGADDRDRPYLAALKAELDAAAVLPPPDIPPDVVTMNTQVRLRDGRRTWTIVLVYPEDADAELGKISVLAPLGAAILGYRVGDTVKFRVPGGDERSCDILKVESPEAAGHARPL